MDSYIYSIKSLDEYDSLDKLEIFAFVVDDDKRAQSCLNDLINMKAPLKKVIIFTYNNALDSESPIHKGLDGYNFINIVIPSSTVEFIKLLGSQNFFEYDNVLIDISCLRIPELFPLLKHLKMSYPKISLSLAYSIPFDYEFYGDPFISFKSFSGDIATREMLGFSGSGDEWESDLIIFLGFEGALSLKIIEDISYKDLILVNNLPSFYQKYKDISIICNYQLLQNTKSKLLNTPADNPFETYNLLESQLEGKCSACIAPLSTKPVALGVCLYALSHDSVRVVYPISDKYISNNTHDVHKTLVYSFPL